MPRPTMMLVAVWASKDSIAVSNPIEPCQIGHDSGRDFSICLGAFEDNHGDHAILLQGGTIQMMRGNFYC